MLRKLISLLCVAAMLCAVIPCAFAEDLTVGETDEVTTLPSSYDNVVNDGTITAAGDDLDVTTAITNNGTIAVRYITTSGGTDLVVTNNEDGKINANIVRAETITNSGEMHTTSTVKVDNLENSNVFEANKVVSQGIDANVSVNNSGTLTVHNALNASTIENTGTITAGSISDTANVTNYNTITVGSNDDAKTYYGVSKDYSDGSKAELVSKDESNGLGIAEGESFTVNLEHLANQSGYYFKGWQINGTDKAKVGEYTFTVKAATFFKALWERFNPATNTNIAKWVDSEVKMVKDADGKELEQGVEYSHVAITTAKEYVVLFSTGMLKAMGKGVHEFTIVLTNGTEIPYSISVG